MALIAPTIRHFQSKWTLDCPGDNLDNDHIAKSIVYMIDKFEKEKKLFCFLKGILMENLVRNSKMILKKMLGLHVFATFRLQRTCRKIESFLSDNNEACKYITNNELPKKKQKSMILKIIMNI